MFCRNCGQEIDDKAAICIHCGCPTQNQTANGRGVDPTDAPSTGMAVLGFFIPLAGLIIYAINHDTKPKMAKSAGKGALIGFIVNIALSVLFYIFYFLFFFMLGMSGAF